MRSLELLPTGNYSHWKLLPDHDCPGQQICLQILVDDHRRTDLIEFLKMVCRSMKVECRLIGVEFIQKTLRSIFRKRDIETMAARLDFETGIGIPDDRLAKSVLMLRRQIKLHGDDESGFCADHKKISFVFEC
ncbi:MAG: hypothetical protein IPM55_06075 [Acidobacteria bacterium]|nr:hypothetical protein [Acidobacteriota bacterium]